ncbi:oligosaccharyl transferase subunit ost3/OST6, partial [Gryganskiella cystojenkinii]
NFDPEYRLVASGWSHLKDRSQLLFASLDFKAGQAVFQKFGMNNAPSALYFPPSADSANAAPPAFQRYDFGKSGFQAEPFAAWLSSRSGVSLTVRRPFDVVGFALKVLALLGMGAVGHFMYNRAGKIIRNKYIWAAASLFTIFIMISGHMWNQIKNPPYTMPGREGGLGFLAQGFQNQFGLETQIIAMIYAVLCCSVVSLISNIPRIEDPTKQRFAVWVWIGVFGIMYSVLMQFFRLKNPGYPFRLLRLQTFPSFAGMATFHALSPPLGSQQSRQAPDLFSIELELLLPEDHFLPAQNIVAQVWTNILHRLNPDGPETWAEVPMKLSHVTSIAESSLGGGSNEHTKNKRRSVAVFATRLQPTGRGDFGLTARWKAHKDMTEWQWAPTAITDTLQEQQEQSGGTTLIATTTKDGEPIKNRDVSITIRVPRSISGTSSWSMGPQSILVYGQHGPRLDGLLATAASSSSNSPSIIAAATTTASAMAMIGGPGLYLGNHAAATRARISGYEAVLSLVGDLLDFDEGIPESDKDINKNAWLEQAKAKELAQTPPKKFSALSRSSSLSFSNGPEEGGVSPLDMNGSTGLRDGLMKKRSSVSDFMSRYEPGLTTGQEEEEFLAGVVTEPEEGPRLTRKTSVTNMMVPLPVSSSPPVSGSSRRLSRSSYSGSFTSIAELEASDRTTTAATPSKVDKKISTSAGLKETDTGTKAEAAIGNGNGNGNGTTLAQSSNGSTPTAQGKKGSNASLTTTDAAAVLPPAPTTATAAPPLSKKEKAKAALSATAASSSSASLPPVSGKVSPSSTGSGRTNVALSSPTIASLGIGAAFPTLENKTLSNQSSVENKAVSIGDTEKTKESKAPAPIISTVSSNNAETSPPPSSAKVMSTLTSSFSSSAMIASLSAELSSSSAPPSSSSSTTSTEPIKESRPFSHKVISLPPGSHNRISDANLKEAVTFLLDEVAQGKKVLVHCRDGHGRSGSVAIAYLVAREQIQQNKELREKKKTVMRTPSESYQAALNEIWKWKCDVYPHKGLRQSLERIEW